MREIKFRAWISEKITQESKGFMHHEGDGSDFMVMSSGGNFGLIVDYDQWGCSDDFEVMQYIGLKDKNGAEIYEGDILKKTIIYRDDFGFNERVEVKVVEYDENNAAFSNAVIHNSDIYISNPGSIEVIGNIHENPELLEGIEK